MTGQARYLNCRGCGRALAEPGGRCGHCSWALNGNIGLWTFRIDDPCATYRAAFLGPWQSAVSTCPICGVSVEVTAPIITPTCDHWLARLVPGHALVLCLGREYFQQSRRLMPEIERVPLGDEPAEQLVRAGYHLGHSVMEPMLTAAAYMTGGEWPVECEAGTVVDLFVEQADATIALVNEALGLVREIRRAERPTRAREARREPHNGSE